MGDNKPNKDRDQMGDNKPNKDRQMGDNKPNKDSNIPHELAVVWLDRLDDAVLLRHTQTIHRDASLLARARFCDR
jgi:hypothetical protein